MKMVNKYIWPFCLFALVILLDRPCSGAPLVGWDNDETVHGAESWDSGYQSGYLAGPSQITAGAGIRSKTSPGGLGAAVAMKYNGLAASIQSFTAASTAQSYLKWTVAAPGTNTIEVNKLELATVNLDQNVSLTLDLRSSVDGFASSLGTQTAQGSGDLGVLTFHIRGLKNITTVEFRLYCYWTGSGQGDSSTSLHFRNDKTTLATFPEAVRTGLNDPVILLGGSVLTPSTDSDNDGLTDLEEVSTYGTNPHNRDTDGDGTPDGLEIERGLDPNDPSDRLDRPNIILFFTDDQGYGEVGCFYQDTRSGIYKFDTPALDSMAAEGAKMTHHYVAAPICLPSRSSLLQGRHQGHSDARNIQFDKALPDNHTLADTLQRAGYRTIHIGKSGVAGKENSVHLTGKGSQNLAAHPMKRGFDEFFGYLFHIDGHEHYPRNGTTNKSAFIYHGYQQVNNASVDLYTTDAWTAYAKDAITREVNDGDDQPFFLYLAYEAPHFNNQRPAVAYPSGKGLTGGVQWTTETDESGNVRYASTADGSGVVDAYNHPDNHHAWSENQQRVVGMIRRVDNSIGDIMQHLKDLGIDDNTLVVFTTDNGPDPSTRNPREFGTYAHFEGVKGDILEGGLRVPTIVRWPSQIAGVTNDENNIHEINYASGTWDWMPTFADIAGVTAPAWCDGVSLLPTLTGKGVQRDKGYLYFEYKGYGGTTPNYAEFPNHGGAARGEMQAVRVGKYMGIRKDIASATNLFEIYDVTSDLGQGTDLASSMTDLQQQMQDIALQSRRPLNDAPRPYDSAVVPNVTRKLEAGLNYSAYQGIWSYTPEFRDMTPVKQGQVDTPDVALRSRDDNAGLLFTGYIKVPVTGDYTFHLDTDSRSHLFIHDAHVIDNDYNHRGLEQSGTIKLASGLHPFRLYYSHTTGTRHRLDLSWSSSKMAKTSIPAATFYRIPKIKMSLQKNAAKLNLRWNSLIGRSYRLRASEHLAIPPKLWTVLQTGVAANPPFNTLTISMPTADKQFYVIQEE